MTTNRPAKKAPAKAGAVKSIEGMPFSLASQAVGFDPIEWLDVFSERADLLIEMRPDIDQETIQALKGAKIYARLAKICIEGERAREAVISSMRALQSAWWIEMKLGVMPKIRRDHKLQNAKRKPRRAEIDEWIDKAIVRLPDATRDELWAEAPQRIKDDIGIDRFKKRVSKARVSRK